MEPAINGEVGEVVVTKLNSSYPMLRLATGDLSSIIDETSPCGRTNMRIKGWMGRADQTTKIKGLFVDMLQELAYFRHLKFLEKYPKKIKHIINIVKINLGLWITFF